MKILFLILFGLNLYSFQDFDLPQGKWWRNEDVIREIHLTEEQQKKLENAFYDHLEKAVDLRAKVEKEELKLSQLLDEDKIIEKEVLSQVERLLDARKELEKARAELFIKVRIILTPEQWIKIKDKFRNKLRKMKEERRRSRPIPPPEPQQNP